ncbi:MAG: hypothetical protein NTW28_22220 [Candidatus Solibacter sp.]|nr:hypothetical protein [Candidatus Solibacter sp.]
MNTDALVLALLAIGDLALIVHLRQRHAQRVRMERVMTSLRTAVRRANDVEALPAEHPLLPAS